MPLPSRPPAAPELLRILHRTDPNTLIAVSDMREPGRVSVRALPPDPRCGAAALFGIRAPAGSCAVGASFRGRATLAGSPAGEVRVDVVVDRGATVASTVTPVDGYGTVGADARSGTIEDGVDGRIVDALHRVLGLTSPGQPPALEWLIVALWMDRIVGELAAGRCPSWADVVAAHPAQVEDTHATPPRVPPSPEVVAGLTGALTTGARWARLRRSAAAGRLRIPELDADEAAWMDPTLFARWTVESFPPPAVVLGALRDLGASGTADGVEAVMGLLPPATGLA